MKYEGLVTTYVGPSTADLKRGDTVRVRTIRTNIFRPGLSAQGIEDAWNTKGSEEGPTSAQLAARGGVGSADAVLVETQVADPEDPKGWYWEKVSQLVRAYHLKQWASQKGKPPLPEPGVRRKAWSKPKAAKPKAKTIVIRTLKDALLFLKNARTADCVCKCKPRKS